MVREHTDHLDQLVHCAAKAINGPLLELDPQELRESVIVNGLALVDLIREAGAAARPAAAPSSTCRAAAAAS